MASNTIPGRFSFGDLACEYPRAATVLGATLATLAIWAISTYAGQVDMTVNGSKVGPLDVALATLVAGLAGWGLLAFLERRTKSAWTIWRNIAIAVLVLSMLGPIGAEEASGRTALSVMHAFAGAIIIRNFSRTAPRR
jgi:uncharacterized membrane protein